ncbi:MAG: tetratricopeptide repeat protein [Verrucomicrobiae bacterium]|nr:tetratricopeptide repeat protein [Verrucomicrobiae bacterium]MCB1090704.1 tetratricopeptide repeat protein [Verrucomicrobiae bacterium]
MKTRLPLIATLSLALVVGCQTRPVAAPGPIPPKGTPIGREQPRPPQPTIGGSGSIEDQFRIGRALLENGNHTGAIKQFAYLRDHAATPEDRDRAVIALAMALQDSGNRGAALGTLEPLPLAPVTGLDARKCVLAGEIYLHQQKFDLARTWLSRGLETEPDSRSPYRATALFNLGKALLAEENLQDARVAFFEAQELFLLNRDEANARQCELVATDIRRALQ